MRGVTGHECVNELIFDRLFMILGIPHLSYRLIHADIIADGKVRDVYLCAADDFKEKASPKLRRTHIRKGKNMRGETGRFSVLAPFGVMGYTKG